MRARLVSALLLCVACRSTEAAPTPPAASAPAPTPSAQPVARPTSACPDEMAHLQGFCIDRHEDHLVTLGPDGRETPYPPTERPKARVAYVARSTAGVMPQAYINRLEAQAACERAHKRLCTLGEWYSACAGPKLRTYPYGPDLQRGVCNASKAHLLSRMFGDDPRRWTYDEQFNSPLLDQEPGFLAPTGSYSRCATPEGVFDLVGNLHEWVSDQVDDELPHKIELIDDLRGRIQRNWRHGIFMGGFFSTTSEHGPGCRFVTIGHEPKYHDYSTGFRCCRDAVKGAGVAP